MLRPESFGAVGNGVADDTLAIQRALDAVPIGGTLLFGEGRTYRHSDLLVARVAGAHLTGPGVLLASNEARSAFWITADNVLVDGGLAFHMGRTTRRWDSYEQMKLRLAGVRGTALRGIKVEGAAAAGIYIGQSSGFLLEDVSVSNTRADGIHLTAGSHDGTVRRATITNSGDDGISVVSYQADGAVSNHITVESPVVRTTSWGRGLSVVGGEDITYRNVDVDSSSGAAIYVANEGAPYYTYSSKRVSLLGGALTRANTDSGVDHGAILLYSARSGFGVQNVLVDGIAISDTRASASGQVGIISDGGEVFGALLRNVTVRGGGRAFSTNVRGTSYSTVHWVVDGAGRPDHIS